MNAYGRLFGAGPPGLALSGLLLYAAARLRPALPFGPLVESDALRLGVLAAGTAATLLLATWGLHSLPPHERGRSLRTTGAFRWVRHPLYASFLSVFDFALAFWLNHAVFLAWALLLHPLWHLLVRYEERLMIEAFGKQYLAYARVTGRFVPRWRSARHSR